ncbi:hypothetical protein PSN45_002404 [Yamadazyma tenuis]|uniref:F-box domain-containing protein n=1 Tax=Candida tenuis (strain ATCC 10573 / BCRC 21748 / CBS 615 / JCM 9827 / NBRC 10315 / NRRL Y-1498 / VKM Y-70) TaxID=590646 RepID=G3B0K9_CANTC|nr:uncharacterized protein CANTEDRAFT_133724 [Yamadazyma tenuis ATCC 10573]EGV65418.1 hypothetical protein CANTEDRAFT_133724 [Yamadazyma tenuis ATCC 10573]WEJ94902.1 hypothetical protein PSN45_002404 [Yamadazyma tenuis]
MYQFNSPIGYSKKPLVYDGRKKEGVGSGDGDAVVWNPAKNVSLDKLPVEILSMIIHYLDQFDSLKLMMTNRIMYALVKPKLYENIIIDSNYSEFNKEFRSYKFQHQHQMTNTTIKLTATFIKSSYNFKRFLSAYDGTAVRRLQCISFPDSVTVLDGDVNDLIVRLFEKLRGLHELVWVPANFKMDFLRHLDLNSNTVISLVVNIRFNRQNLQVLSRFRHLVNFQLGPYTSTDNLRQLVQFVDMSKLRILKLWKSDTQSNICDPSAARLLDYPHGHELEDVNILSTKQFKCLTKLCLKEMFVCEGDFASFASSVSTSGLTKLEFKRITEYKTGHADSFLLRLSRELQSITELMLDYRESHKDNIPEFLRNINHLHKLDLVVRNNDTKTFDAKQYSRSLQVHADTLAHLSLEIYHEKSLGFQPVAVDLQKVDLSHATKLESLRINSTDEIDSVRLVAQLPRLRYLNLFGMKAGGSPNLGLGMIHPTVFDEWFKVQHVALIYLENNGSLEYVKINSCLFECRDGEVVPREGIDNWFNEVVRVAAIDYD